MTTIRAAMTSFLSGLNSPRTVSAYATPLKHFAAYLAEQGLSEDEDAASLTVDHAIGFVPWLRERSPAKATLQLYLTAVYRFYRSLLLTGVPLEATDLARLEESYRNARNIRGEKRPKDPKLEAVRAVIQAARAAPAQPTGSVSVGQLELIRARDVAILETLRSTGCRVGELISLTLTDIKTTERRALVKGKGSKWRSVYWDEEAWQALMAYLRLRHPAKDGPLFCGHGNRSRGPLTTRHVSRLVRKLGEQVGVKDVTPHYFRHVFATRALGRTGNLALVQDMLGHASPATTRVYARTDEGQRAAGHAQVWA